MIHEYNVHIRRSYSSNEFSLHVTKIRYMNTMSLLSVTKLAFMRYEICELLLQINRYIGSCVNLEAVLTVCVIGNNRRVIVPKY